MTLFVTSCIATYFLFFMKEKLLKRPVLDMISDFTEFWAEFELIVHDLDWFGTFLNKPIVYSAS